MIHGNVHEFIRVSRLPLRQESVRLVLEVTERSLGTIRSIRKKQREQLSEAIGSFSLSGVSFQTSNTLVLPFSRTWAGILLRAARASRYLSCHVRIHCQVKSTIRERASSASRHAPAFYSPMRRQHFAVVGTARSIFSAVPGRYLTFGAAGRLTG